MASDTDTKKTKSKDTGKPRWFRLAPVRPDLPEFDHLLDLYWGGPERRITGITVRIIGVNAIALLILVFGILYLGQYQNNLINARLETFESELELVSVALSEGALTKDKNAPGRIDMRAAKDMATRLSQTTHQRLQLFDHNGNLILDSRTLPDADDRFWNEKRRRKENFQSVEVLKGMAKFILDLLPDKRTLPTYPQTESENFLTYPDVPDALDGQVSLSVWETQDDRIFLSAAAPLFTGNTITGAVLLTRAGTEIEEDIGRVWVDVLKIFGISLVLTIMLSIYLSGVIARPLKRLAKATESVRKGQAKADDIPDLSHRHDEIGELSVALRHMTQALWDRMDSIEQFAADVSHELKNPLTSLRSAVETAAKVKKDTDRKKLMDIIKHDVERLDRLITDIANASRIDSEMSREAFEKINLGDLLSNVLETYAVDPLHRANEKTSGQNRQVKTAQATMNLNIMDEKNIEVWGLKGRLAQVFQNLLSNALSFTPKGGTITVLVVPLNKKVSIVVEDEGPGIPKSKLESIFERFYSERPESEDYGQHSGLGLSICRQIIEAHGGQVFAENVKGQNGKITGARFTVILNKA